MRRDQIFKICLNFFLDGNVEFKRKDDTSWTFGANDFSEGEFEPTSFAIRFKNKIICDGFKKAIDDALEGRLEEIEPPCDQVITYENNSEVLKQLMLPEDFFNYQNLPDCAGCIGCKSDEYVFSEVPQTELVIEDKKPLPLKKPTLVLKNNDKPRRPSQDKHVSFKLTAVKKTNDKPKVVDVIDLTKEGPSVKDKNSVKSDLFGIKKSEATTNIFAQFNAENPPPPNPSSNIFGQSSLGENKTSTFSSPSIFSSSLNTTPTTNADKIKSDQQPNSSSSSILNSSSNNLFGNKTNFSFGSVSNGVNSIFGGENKAATTTSTPAFGSGASIFGSTALNSSGSEAKSSDKSTANIFGSSNASSFSFAEAVKELDKSKTEDGSKPSEPDFLKNTSSIAGFAELAAASSSSPASSFSALNLSAPGGLEQQRAMGFFGLTVKDDFFSKNLNKQNVSENADTSQNDSETVNDDNYDPHYDPIISLPDEIKVSTGEEDEEKVFGERAKLYRYDVNTKEWKERGKKKCCF